MVSDKQTTNDEVEALLEQALDYYADEDDEKAITLLLKAHELNPTNQPVVNALGNIYYEIGDYSNALIFSGKMLDLDCDNVITYIKKQLV